MSNVDQEPEKKRIAQHYLLDSAGAVVEDFEKASTVRYVDIATGATIDFTPTAKVGGQAVTLDPGCAALMGSLFGFRTLMTNEASAIRNSKEGGTAQEQVGAIQDRLTLIEGGTWVDRTREPGARWDQPTLASAMVQVMVADGSCPDEESDRNALHARLLQKMAEDEKFAGTMRQVPGVEAAYKKLAGKPTKSSADILKAL